MRKLLSVVAFVSALCLALPAVAATPESGKLTKSKRSIAWSGSAPFPGESPFPGPPYVSDAIDQNCHSDPTNFTCDHFALKITLGEGASVQIKITDPASNPPGGTSPINGDDWDLYVYDPTGKLIASSTSPTARESVTIAHHKQFNGKTYDVSVRPWLVQPGAGYKGTVSALSVGK
jgi:hypothetical protein